VDLGKEDVYACWSSFWPEFVDMVAEASKELNLQTKM
jgi:hypothetical protein